MESSTASNKGSNQPRNRNFGFTGLYIFVIEPVINQMRSLIASGSPRAILISIRYLRYIICHDSYCSVCGRKVREHWIPIVEYYLDYILELDETTKPFDPAYIGCKFCDPFLQCLANMEKQGTSYII